MFKLGNNNISFCRGVNKVYKIIKDAITNPIVDNGPFIGWYDPGITSPLQTDSSGNIPVGNVSLFYWNGLIDRYNNGGGFTKASYLTALDNMLLINPKKSIIALPYWDVSGNYTESNKLLSWWPDIINATKNHPNVIGYYALDEAEVWGYFNPIPELSHTDAMAAYNLIKEHTTKDVYAVFVDVTLFLRKYDGLSPFFDVFMFDAYDFVIQSIIDSRCGDPPGSINPAWCYLANTQAELDNVEARLLRWKTEVIVPNNYTRVVFVMQGHGDTRQDPITGVATTSPNYVFGMRTMTDEQYTFVVNVIKDNFEVEGVLVWSWFYANDATRERANRALLTFKN